MGYQDRAKVNETLQEELGNRAYAALGSENASQWNTCWAIDSRYIDSRVPPASYPRAVAA